MGVLDNKKIFTQNNKTRKFYNTKFSRSIVFAVMLKQESMSVQSQCNCEMDKTIHV